MARMNNNDTKEGQLRLTTHIAALLGLRLPACLVHGYRDYEKESLTDFETAPHSRSGP